MIITIPRNPNRFNPGYPVNPATLGEKIRKKRMDLHMSIKALAGTLDVHEKSIVNWEHDRVKPKKRLLEKVMGFLGN